MYEKEIERGVAILDEEVGPDWYLKINTDKLDMRDGCNCIRSQVLGDYLAEPFYYTTMVEDYGFTIFPSIMHVQFQEARGMWERLTFEWKLKLEELHNERTVPTSD